MSGADPLQPVPTPRRRRHGLTVTLAVAAVTVGLIAPGVASAFTWGLPASTLSTVATTNEGAQVAVAPDGTTTVVWSQTDPTDSTLAVIMAATRLPGQTSFGAPQLISGSDLAGTPGVYGSPKIAVGPDGTTVVVWRDGSSDGIFATARAAGQPRFPTTAPQRVFLPDTGFDTFSTPEVVAAPDGSFTVVWTVNSGTSTSKVMAATRLAGETSFSGVQDLSGSGTHSGLYMPKVAAAPDGSVVAIWSYPVGSSYIIQTATRPAGQRAFGGAEAISGASGIRPRIAIGPDGRVTAVWVADPGVSETIRSSTRAPGATSFSAPVGVPSAGVMDLQVVVAPDGETTVVSASDFNASIKSSTRGPGLSTWGPEEVIAQCAEPTSCWDPRVAVAQDGRITVVWTRFDDVVGQHRSGRITSIYSVTRSTGAAAWSSSTRLDPAAGSYWGVSPSAPPAPAIVVAPNGEATAVWKSVNNSTDTTLPTNMVIKTASTDATSYTATVATAGTGSGTVTSSPSGIDCGATCTASFRLSTSLVLTAQPAAGSSFAGWGGACSGTSSTCTVSVLGDRSVTATFTLNPSTKPAARQPLRVKASTSPDGTAVTSGTVPDGATRVVQTVTPIGARRAKARTVRCAITKADGVRTFRCRVTLTAGRWRLTTNAMAGSVVVAQSVRKVTVRARKPAGAAGSKRTSSRHHPFAVPAAGPSAPLMVRVSASTR